MPWDWARKRTYIDWADVVVKNLGVKNENLNSYYRWSRDYALTKLNQGS